MPDLVDRLRKLALAFADVEETVACAGTAIEQAVAVVLHIAAVASMHRDA